MRLVSAKTGVEPMMILRFANVMRPAFAKADRVAFRRDLHRVGFVDHEDARGMRAKIARSLRATILSDPPAKRRVRSVLRSPTSFEALQRANEGG